MDRSEMRRLVEKVTSLPTLPGSVTRITKMLDDTDTTAAEVGREIEKDQVLSAKVLKLVNSGFYGFSQPISTIQHAMVLLGFNVVKTLVLSTSVLDMMSNSMAGLWQHSLACARTCAIIARFLDLDDPEEISVTGLLHDLGKVVLESNVKEVFDPVITLVKEKDMLFYKAEEEVMEITHATVGGWLLDQWQLPGQLVEPIMYHHDFHPSRTHALRTGVVHLADILVRAEGFGSGGDRRIPVLSEEAMKVMGLDVDDVKEIMEEMTDEMRDMMR
ncbi:MAG: HDOD domain-containing protein [Candidatus Latescibacteria bacterium]|jgi:putative nucleotidyltransferase with HDIG domain|nr:HDOD domain-containing protein [Candidatus Latescibacterota bacterium]MBT4138014.1 HDOD domain-containing protein [Candidatus Latescibacterota bacterium]